MIGQTIGKPNTYLTYRGPTLWRFPLDATPIYTLTLIEHGRDGQSEIHPGDSQKSGIKSPSCKLVGG